MSKYIKVKMLRDDTHGKKGKIITVEERYAQLYLFPKKAILVEDDNRNKSKIELPIPKHLKKIIIQIGDNNNESHMDGVVRCTCGCETFLISVFGGNNGKDICVGEYERDYALIVKATCMDCDKNNLIFDMSKHGWNGYVCLLYPKKNCLLGAVKNAAQIFIT